LQRLRAKESQEKEAEKIFNATHPQYPPPQKRWTPKGVEINQMTTEDKIAGSQLLQVRRTVRPSSLDHPPLCQNTSNDAPTPMEEDDLLRKDLVDYEATPEQSGMDVNVIMFSANCTIISDDEPVVAWFDFCPKVAAFTKPKESVNHLKPLFVRGHINGISIAKMLVGGGAALNLMSYSLYRKFG
jgi:hypothetical protein